MIFDGPEFEALRSRYIDEPDYNVPLIVLLDRKKDFSDERDLLEACIQSVSPEKQKEWLGRLYAKEEEQFISAWFEVMLFDWLKPCGTVEVEPELLGNRPDFLIKTGNQEIVIEAKAFLISQSDRNMQRWRSALFSAIECIQLPYIIEVKAARLVALPDTNHLSQDFKNWLITKPNEKFEYKDRFGNIIVCESIFEPALKHAGAFWSPSMGQWINPDVLKPALQEKAKTNRALRKAGYPYIIALFIEPFLFSVEEVINAWFGNETVVIDVNEMKIVEMKRDRRGLHLYRNQISHRTISGTLVIKAESKDGFKGRKLQSWYIENPYASSKVDPDIFPIESKFVVVNRTATDYQMAWR